MASQVEDDVVLVTGNPHGSIWVNEGWRVFRVLVTTEAPPRKESFHTPPPQSLSSVSTNTFATHARFFFGTLTLSTCNRLVLMARADGAFPVLSAGSRRIEGLPRDTEVDVADLPMGYDFKFVESNRAQMTPEWMRWTRGRDDERVRNL